MAATTLRDVIERFRSNYLRGHTLNDAQHRAVHDILACRTEALGIQRRLACQHCGQETLRYCSCRNRHCPRCQRAASGRWVERQQAAVLPTHYFHLVFTLPHELNALARDHPKPVYASLFDAVWKTLARLSRQRLHGQLGVTAVLHTWGQTLTHHIHLHCLIPAGAFDAGKGRWYRARSRYLFPVKVMQRLFRGQYVSLLRAKKAKIGWPGSSLTGLLDQLMTKTWNVHAKPVIGHAPDVLAYLGRYTHRIAISENRLIGISGDQVLIRYRDYRQDNRSRVMSLDGVEFMRRYLTHVLPHGFQRIRHYGFLANRVRAERVERITALLGNPAAPPQTPSVSWCLLWTCPGCGAKQALTPAMSHYGSSHHDTS